MAVGSFSAGLSGLNANAVYLSVIGNNLANINTVGFKASSVARKISAVRQFHQFLFGEGIRGDDPTGTEEYAPAGKLVDHGKLFSDAQRIMHGQN